MNKVAIVFWSGSGNTEQMANFISQGVRGAEQLEEDEFEPMFSALKSSLSGKKACPIRLLRHLSYLIDKAYF